MDQRFNLYTIAGPPKAGRETALDAVVAGLGLEVKTLVKPDDLVRPAVILLRPGQKAPKGLADIAISPPPDTSVSALREMIRMALENLTLKQDVAQLHEQAGRQHTEFEELNRIGIALSAERDIKKLQEFILQTMRQLTNADGASLWLKTEENGEPKLFLASSQNNSLANTYQAFTVPLDDKSVVGYTVTAGSSQIYDDAYNPPPGKPKGGRGFDAQFGYRTKSMLTVPMRNYTGEVVGAIQLINAKHRFDTKLTIDTVDQEVVSFRPDDLKMLESVASQAAVALDKQKLLEGIQALFDGFVDASVDAIERRDPTTAGHSRRVELLTTGLAKAVSGLGTGKFRNFGLTEDQFQELRYACLLHDFGKVGVHEHILIKAKKLPPGQLEVIQTRLEYVEQSVQVKYLTEKLEALRSGNGRASEAALDELDRRREEEIGKLRHWIQAIVEANEPSVLPTDTGAQLEPLSQLTYYDIAGKPHPMLDPQEFRFLSIRKGTLDPDERKEIESHVRHSFEFLKKIPWTSTWRGVPDIAYGHHELLDGSGYPQGLSGDQIPPQARMMTIADIYDALTARDRPYKRAVPVNAALDILRSEADGGKLDKDLLDVFITKGVYLSTSAAP